MKDLIDEKNKQDKMKRSIIKFWNVSYGEPELVGAKEPETVKESISDTDRKKEDMLQTEDPAETVQAETEDSIPMSRIEQILQEKDAKLQEIIEQERAE